MDQSKKATDLAFPPERLSKCSSEAREHAERLATQAMGGNRLPVERQFNARLSTLIASGRLRK